MLSGFALNLNSPFSSVQIFEMLVDQSEGVEKLVFSKVVTLGVALSDATEVEANKIALLHAISFLPLTE